MRVITLGIVLTSICQAAEPDDGWQFAREHARKDYCEQLIIAVQGIAPVKERIPWFIVQRAAYSEKHYLLYGYVFAALYRLPKGYTLDEAWIRNVCAQYWQAGLPRSEV